MNNNYISIRKHICILLNKWLKDNNVTDIALANAVGVSPSSVRRWKIGECIPDIDLFPKLCNFMGISILEFMGFDDVTYLSEKQSQLLRKYQDDEIFHKLIDNYKDNDEFRLAINTLIKLMK